MALARAGQASVRCRRRCNCQSIRQRAGPHHAAAVAEHGSSLFAVKHFFGSVHVSHCFECCVAWITVCDGPPSLFGRKEAFGVMRKRELQHAVFLASARFPRRRSSLTPTTPQEGKCLTRPTRSTRHVLLRASSW